MPQQRKQLNDLKNPLELAELNKQLNWVFSQLLGNIGSKAIAKAGVDALNLSFSAVAAANAWGRNRILAGNQDNTSSVYLIGNYETAELSAGAKYTFVVKGHVNEGQMVSVRFDGGTQGGVSASFDSNGIAIIKCTAPSSFSTSEIGFYNAPQATATDGTIDWACMYPGYLEDPNLEWVAAPEDYRSELSLLEGLISAKVDAGALSSYLDLIAGTGVVIGQTDDQSKAVIDGRDFVIRRGDPKTGALIAAFGSGGGDISDLLVRGLLKHNGFVLEQNSTGGTSLKKL